MNRLAAICLLASCLAAAQNPPNAPSASQTESEKDIQKKEQSKRIFGVVPMFGVTSRQNAPPLTPEQKFH